MNDLPRLLILHSTEIYLVPAAHCPLIIKVIAPLIRKYASYIAGLSSIWSFLNRSKAT